MGDIIDDKLNEITDRITFVNQSIKNNMEIGKLIIDDFLLIIYESSIYIRSIIQNLTDNTEPRNNEEDILNDCILKLNLISKNMNIYVKFFKNYNKIKKNRYFN